MIELVTKNLDAIQATCREYDVDALWVFGSAVRDDWVEGKSDVDFIAKFGKSERNLFRQHMGFISELEDIIEVRADVVDVRSISKPYLREEIERTQILIYEQTSQPIDPSFSKRDLAVS